MREQKRARIAAGFENHRDARRASAREPARCWPADRQHRRDLADRIGEHGFMRGQLRELAGHAGGNFRIGIDQASGRKTVRLREDDVDAEHARLARRDLVDQLRHARPRPRPLAVLREALVVDRDDLPPAAADTSRGASCSRKSKPRSLRLCTAAGSSARTTASSASTTSAGVRPGAASSPTRPGQPSSRLLRDLVLR